MATFLACPFCRALFTPGERARCPECDVELLDLDTLPTSTDALHEAWLRGEYTPPEDRHLGWLYARRGRGLLAALSVAGLALFFAPWVEMTQPESVTITGYTMARFRAGWLWGGAVGWFILLALVTSRTNVRQLRGVRAIAALLASLTLVEAVFLLALAPSAERLVPTQYTYAWGLYASGFVSLVGTLAAMRLGGSPEDLRDVPQLALDANPDASTLH